MFSWELPGWKIIICYIYSSIACDFPKNFFIIATFLYSENSFHHINVDCLARNTESEGKSSFIKNNQVNKNPFTMWHCLINKLRRIHTFVNVSLRKIFNSGSNIKGKVPFLSHGCAYLVMWWNHKTNLTLRYVG